MLRARADVNGLPTGQHHPARDAVHHARRRGVPGDRRGHDPGPAAGMEPEVVVGRVAGVVRGVEEADHEQDLGDLQRQEDPEDGRVHLHAGDQHVRVEDREREQEPGQRVRQVTAGVGRRASATCRRRG